MTKEEFLDHFERLPNGHWLCLKPIAMKATYGTIYMVRGSIFGPGVEMAGIDVAVHLDALAKKYGR